MVTYSALRELIPVFPVYALLFTDAGLSTGQVSSLFVVWSATHVLLEVPSGAWADTVSRRGLLVVAAALYGCCFALWTAVPTYAAFAGGFVLWGLSSSLVSGTYEAYVYDHLHARGDTAAYRRVIAAGDHRNRWKRPHHLQQQRDDVVTRSVDVPRTEYEPPAAKMPDETLGRPLGAMVIRRAAIGPER